MGFGLNLNAGGDYLPVLKYDARAGRLFRMDRDEVTGEQDPVDITEAFEAAVDFAHGEAGWCWFQAGQAPDFVMVPIGEALPPQPTKNHKQGVRLRLLLSSKAAAARSGCANWRRPPAAPSPAFRRFTTAGRPDTRQTRARWWWCGLPA